MYAQLYRKVKSKRIKSLLDNKLDTTFTTNNPTILKGIRPTLPVISLQKSADKMICQEEDFIRSDKLSFGSDIGSITNKSTALFDILACFEPGSKQAKISNKAVDLFVIEPISLPNESLSERIKSSSWQIILSADF